MGRKKQAKTVAMGQQAQKPTEQELSQRSFPDKEYARLKGFKLKRVNLLVDINGHSRELLPGAKITAKFLEKEKAAVITAVKITDSQEGWCIRIPSTFAIANIIVQLYESGKKEDEDILSTLLCNYANVSAISDGLFHNLILNCCTLYLLKQDKSKTVQEKKREYFGVLKSAIKNCLIDLDSYEQVSREEMEKANKEYEKLIAAGEMKDELENQPS